MSHWDECQHCMVNDDPAVMHVYGQDCEHEEAFIVGNETALRALRDALDAALNGGLGQATVFAADGEGYILHVIKHPTQRIDRLQLPYSGWERRYGMERRGRYPASLVPFRDDQVLDDDEWFAAQLRLGTDYEKPG